MTTFQFDTSGVVMLTGNPRPNRPSELPYPMRWPDLSPFVQGYVKALFVGGPFGFRNMLGRKLLERFGPGTKELRRAERIRDTAVRCHGAPVETVAYGFSDLAPETLARIMEDCASAANVFESLGFKTGAVEGARFWRARNDGSLTGVFGVAYPPLTVYLGDDGKVYLQERA